MNILTYSNLFPNNVDESNGIFVERRLRELVERTDVEATVIAPVPWFPFRSEAFGSWSAMARIDARAQRGGIDVHYPRYPLLPAVGMNLAPSLMALGTRRCVEAAVRGAKPIDLIDAHYFYPDGVAASRLARRLGVPCMITARGSDINLIGEFAGPRRRMQEAASYATALIAVSEALAETMVRIGLPEDKIHVLRNGVDLDYFSPVADAARHNEAAPALLSVGALKPTKGHEHALRALPRLPGASLVIAGHGPDLGRLTGIANELGVTDRVNFAGSLPSGELREAYRRADATVLMSTREGLPNVVLESLACGTPVIATRVGGIPEAVSSVDAGVLCDAQSAEALIAAWRALADRYPSPAAVRAQAERFSWDDTIAGLHALMAECATSRQQPATRHISHINQ